MKSIYNLNCYNFIIFSCINATNCYMDHAFVILIICITYSIMINICFEYFNLYKLKYIFCIIINYNTKYNN